ncbi:MAG: glycogen debranching N-terminal domain-containing protein [Candidatus Dormibacter sp.]
MAKTRARTKTKARKTSKPKPEPKIKSAEEPTPNGQRGTKAKPQTQAADGDRSGRGTESDRDQRIFHHGHSTLLSDLGESLTTKASGVFALCGPNGDIDNQVNNAYGLYFHDTRFLEVARLRLSGQPLVVLLSKTEDNVFRAELTNPDLELGHGQALSRDRISIRRQRTIARTVTETIEVANFSSDAVDFELDLEFGASFESMFVVRGADPGKRGTLHAPRWSGKTLTFRYDGADERRRTTKLTFDRPPSQHQAGAASFDVHLRAAGKTTITITVELEDRGSGELENRPTGTPSNPPLHEVQVESDNPLFDRVLNRSFDDLRMLLMREREETFFAAGVPWYVALFGRDSIITALETLAYDPSIASNTLTLLATYQGKRHDAWRDEEPGKILHELRVGEMADLHEVPQTPYYGTVDATPLFIVLLAEYVRWTGDLKLWRRLRGNVDAALAWIDDSADHDGDGFTDYQSKSGKGMVNQGWKDSGNSIRNRDGSLATPPIALVEVQGYVYRAKLDAAWLVRQDGDEERAQRLEADADALRRRFKDAYWMPQEKYLAVALQRDGQRAESITSNPGQALWSGIVDHDHAEAVARRLLSKAMFSGWGIRTLAEGEPSYNPIDYQVGSVWPHDNAMIAAGLKRHGFDKQAVQVFSAIFEAATRFPHYRLPELFAGFSRDEYTTPVRYPVACSPQAWAAGAIPSLLQSVLGIVPDALGMQVHIRRPCLPPWLGSVVLRGLKVGDARLDLRFQRDGDDTLVALLDRKGDVSVRIHY